MTHYTSNMLCVTGSGTATNTAYSLTLGKGTLSGNPTFNVSNNGSGVGTLTLGALYDGGTARTLTKTGSGVLILGTSATSLVQGTTVNITGGTLKSSNTTALGKFAQVTISSSGQFNLVPASRSVHSPGRAASRWADLSSPSATATTSRALSPASSPAAAHLSSRAAAC